NILKGMENESILEGYKKVITESQLLILKKLKEETFIVEDRLDAYKNGFNMSEIGEHTNCSRAAVSKYLNKEMGTKREEYDKLHFENREKLHFANNWYFFVYLSDKEGDYRQSMEFLPVTIRDEHTAYRRYKEYGGETLNRIVPDGRYLRDKEKEDRVVEKLKDSPVEMVAFQERLTVRSVEKIAKRNEVTVFYEKEIGESEYTEKLETWLRKKKENTKQQKKDNEEDEKQ